MKVHSIITLELIQRSFQKSGIWPLNPSVFTNEDFALSMASSSTAHFPSSYPSKIPTSPPAVSSDIESETSDDNYMGYDDSDVNIDPTLQATSISKSESSSINRPATRTSSIQSFKAALLECQMVALAQDQRRSTDELITKL